jgi:hypothetical protein
MKIIPSWRRSDHLAKFGVFLVTAALVVGMVGCGPSFPPLPPSQNLEIRDWHDLDDIRGNLTGHHTLMNDLDSATPGYTELASPTANGGKGWEPIGSFHVYPFTGTFNGQGYEIRDLFINRPNECAVGLFNGVGEGGHIEGVGVVNANVTGSLEAVWHGCDSAGSLVGINLGTVNNSYSTGSVICEWDVGGLVGENSGTVSNSYYSGNVTGKASGGGLVGVNSGTVINSYYNCDEVLINGENVITIGALFSEDFDEWLANDKFLDVNERLSQENGYYLINDVNDFKQLLAFGQNGTLKFRLKNDLDLGDEPNFYIPYLAGELDGNSHKISNSSFNFDFVSPVGLFGQLAPGAKVTQVGVENVNITGADFAGGLVGDNHQGTVSNCYATGSVTRNESIGGLTGRSNGIGGLVGRSDGTVSDSYFSGSVTGEGDVGGLVGDNHFGTVSNSYSTGTMTGTWGTGGLVGSNWRGTVINSYSTGNVTGDGWVGGLVGRNDALKEAGEGTVSNCYSTGSVTGTRGVGGLMGGNGEGTVSNCYSTGSVTGDELVGGLVGFSHKGTVSNSYSTGSVTGNDSVGGLVGDNGKEGTVNNSFWDSETSGQATSDGGEGKTTAEMKNITPFSGAGWNIIAVADPSTHNSSYIWNIVDDVTYPFLSWQPVS